MRINLDVLKKVKLLLNNKTDNMVTLCEKDEATSQKIALYIQKMHDSIPEFKSEDVISYLYENKTEYDCKPYIGIVLVQDYKINPFEIYAITDKDKFWEIHHIFDKSFVELLDVSNECIIAAVESVFNITSDDMTQGLIGTSMASFFINKTKQIEELFSVFQKNPSKAMMWFLCNAVNHLADSNIELVSEYLHSFIRNKKPLLMYAGTQMSKILLCNYWSVIEGIIPIIVEELTCAEPVLEFKEFIAASVSFLYQVCKKHNEVEHSDDYFDLICNAIRSDSDLTKASLSFDIFRELYEYPASYNSNDKEYITILCKSKINNNSKGLLDQIDNLINWQFEHGHEEEAWTNTTSFLSANPNFRISESLDSVCSLILKSLERFLSHIYQSIATARDSCALGLQLIEAYAFQRTKSFSSVNWLKGLCNEDVLTIARKIFVTCLNPQFVTYWGVALISKEFLSDIDRFLAEYKELVCENYPTTALKVVQQVLDSDENTRSELDDIISFCRNIVDERNRISQIKDFSPPYSRVAAYQMAQAKQNAKLSKQGESKSVLYNLVSKVTMKYGARSALLYDDGEKQILKESEYAHFDFSIEMPRRFINDPLFYFMYRSEAFGEVDAE